MAQLIYTDKTGNALRVFCLVPCSSQQHSIIWHDKDFGTISPSLVEGTHRQLGLIKTTIMQHMNIGIATNTEVRIQPMYKISADAYILTLEHEISEALGVIGEEV